MTATQINQIKELRELHGLDAETIAAGMKLELSAVTDILSNASNLAIAVAKEEGDDRGLIAGQFDPFLQGAVETISELAQVADCDSVRLKASMFIAEMCNGTLSPKKAMTEINIGNINAMLTQGLSAYRKNIQTLDFSDSQIAPAEIPVVSERVA